MSRMGRSASLCALVAAAAIGIGACGDDDESTTAASDDATTEETTASADAGTVTVTATEYEFDLSATPSADTESVEFVNDGEEFHVMIFAKINEGFTVEEAIKLQGEKGSAEIVGEAEAQPGKSATAKIKGPIEPGEYAMLCPVGGPKGPHYKLGQLEEFSIE